MAEPPKKPAEKAIYLVGILAWLIPGAGHWLLGLRSRAIIIFATICLTLICGVMLGSIEMIDPHGAKAWFCAQVQAGLPAIIATILQDPSVTISQVYGRGVDIGQVYAGVAGLLNLLCILDALMRCHGLMVSQKTNNSKK